MDNIKAFVGHSFSAEDKEVVDKFLDHFRTLERTYPGFSWDHAEEADLKTLSAKVLAKMQDKNVFIGICTGRERVIEQSALSRSFIQRTTLKAPESAFKIKTSDWIIQEIGLAIGQRMDLVIFLEEGIREPGGLFGDLEYISFSRGHPHEAFDRLLQMLHALSPITASSMTEAKAPAVEPQRELEPTETFPEPDATWTYDQYDMAAWMAIHFENTERLAKIDAAFKASLFAQGDGITVWEACLEFYRLILDKNGDFEKLKGIARDNPTNSKTLSFLAKAFGTFDAFEESAKTFEEAAKYETDQNARLKHLTNAALARARGGSIKQAVEMLEKAKADDTADPTVDDTIVVATQEIAELEKDTDFQIAVLERRADLKPTDQTIRFDLAYKHSQAENNDMAFHHYVRIPVESRTGATWNNLGVSLGRFSANVKSVNAFRKAQSAGETLAMSNLGFKFLGAGFVEEAKEICEKALSIPNYHKNTPQLLSRLSEIPEEEQKKVDDALDAVRPKASFYRKLGEAVLAKSPAKIGDTKWKSPDCILTLVRTGSDISLSGTFERVTNPFGGLLLTGVGPVTEKSQYKLSYIGRIRGKAVIGNVSRTKEGNAASLLDASLSTIKVLMYFNDDESELHLLENPNSINPIFQAFERLPD